MVPRLRDSRILVSSDHGGAFHANLGTTLYQNERFRRDPRGGRVGERLDVDGGVPPDRQVAPAERGRAALSAAGAHLRQGGRHVWPGRSNSQIELSS